jgi:hypothetical protein
MVRLMICREHPVTYDARARLAEIVTASDMVAAPSLSLVKIVRRTPHLVLT